MSGTLEVALSWIEFLAVVTLVVFIVRKVFRRRGLSRTIGPGASGAVYELLNEDKRRAIEVIVEQRTGERDEEKVTGNGPSGSRSSSRHGDG